MAAWLDRIGKLDLGFWKFPDQVVRLAIIFAAVTTCLVMVRCRFIPESFGQEGHYRSDAVVTAASLDIKYAGARSAQTCVSECHDEDESAPHKLFGSYHRTLSCEVCHGPAARHMAARMESEEEDEADAPHIPSKRWECLYCHRYLPSRPTGFPQIIELLHNPMKTCKECHNPHDPTPPEVPGACSACHAQIARTKAISHHSAVACVICHETPEAHMQQPRQNLPLKPTSRAFCGKCHEPGATPPPEAKLTSEIPRVESSKHGGAYLCWQCHYPHFPEGR